MNDDLHKYSRSKVAADWVLMLLRPGIGVKRWLLLGIVGIFVMVSGIAFALSISVSTQISELGRTVTFSNVLDPAIRGVIFGTAGFVIIGAAAYMLYRQLAFGARYTQGTRGIIESLAGHQIRGSGPRIVAIGGGTGLSTLLRGLKEHTSNISAVVTVADDGGSSGRLRDELGMAPPGDARQCLIALSDSELLMDHLFAYRFQEGGSLEGHNLGNLLLAALVDMEGDLHHALDAAARLMPIRGQVLPSSVSTQMRLAARTESGEYLAGESSIGHAGGKLDAIWIEPPDCKPNPAVLEAIASADAIIMGPGSLYTSILPSFLINGISDAVNATHVPKVLVCNIATQVGETDHLSAEDHLHVFERHAKVRVTHFLMNSEVRTFDTLGDGPDAPHAIEPDEFSERAIAILRRDVGDTELLTHHDPRKLSRALIDVLSRQRFSPM
jgi:uncharacterized cofD-like protein